MAALLAQAFRLAASELGMASAAWLFVRETAAAEGSDGVVALRDAMGRNWPVLDAVCAGWLEGVRESCIAPEVLLDEMKGAQRLLLVGYEAEWVDALLLHLPREVRVGLMTAGDPLTDWDRLLANHGGRVEPVDPVSFQTWAGPRSVLLSFVYGHTADHVYVLPTWLRTSGSDVRLQFRALLGWYVMRTPLALFPRWLVAAEYGAFTQLRGTP
ncbi:MAG: hypothetical protein U5L74_10090 [Ideonella sp.]|nr:hypothetical protein [Ideonella sp.]